MMSAWRRTILSAAAASVAILASVAISPQAHAGGYRAVDPPRALAKIDLVARDAKIDKTFLAGHWTFLTIGYTSCPDICPSILSNLASVRARMSQELVPAAIPKILFVSVDPGRDSPSYLADYVANFGKGFVGATGRRAVIDALVDQLGAFYRLGRKDRDGFYTVNHSGEIYLIDPDVRLHARFLPPLDPDRTLADFVALTQAAAPRAEAAGTPKQ